MCKNIVLHNFAKKFFAHLKCIQKLRIIKKVTSKNINRSNINCPKLRIFCDYFENKAETKKMQEGNLDSLDEVLSILKILLVLSGTPYTRPGQTVDRDRLVDRQQFGSRSQIFLIQKKINPNQRVLSIYGRTYLIYLIINTQIGANFTGERCKLCFKKHPNPKTVKKLF